jgi:tetratricopeptide (TPR) repeat protein
MISHPLSPQDNNTQLLARYLNSKDHVQAKLVLQSILGGQRIPTDALRLLCQFADQTRQYDFAVESLCGILALEPSRHAAYYFLGYAMCRLGQFEAGVECFDHALSIEPRESTYALDRASALGELGRHNEALAAYEAILSLDPLHPEAHSYKGNALLALGEVDAAIASFDRAISLEPQAGAAYLNRGNAFLQKAAYALALASYDGAIAVDPSNARAFANRAAALKSLHRLEESLTSSEQAIALEPSFMDARFGMAITQLLAGDLRGGFRNYHVRWQTEVFRPICRQFQQPLWLGESPITGKRLLVHNEQGLGDSIQFCRFVSQAAQAGLMRRWPM